MPNGSEEQQRRVVPEPPQDVVVTDDKARQELEQLTSGKSPEDLEKEARRKDHERGERFRDHFETVAIISMYLISVAMLVFGVVWVLHMILPESCSKTVTMCRWLSADQVTILQDILTGGLIAGILSEHFRRRISR